MYVHPKVSALYTLSHVKLVDFNDYCVEVDCQTLRGAHLDTKILDLLKVSSTSLGVRALYYNICVQYGPVCLIYSLSL